MVCETRRVCTLKMSLAVCTEATSLDWKISVFGKVQCSAIRIADEKLRIYRVGKVGKTVFVICKEYWHSNKLFFYKRFTHNLPIFLIRKVWLNIGICQTLGFSVLKMSPQYCLNQHCVQNCSKTVYKLLVRNSEAMGLFPSKEYLVTNITFFSLLPAQFIPDFFVAEYYGLRNTFSGGLRISPPGGIGRKRPNYKILNFYWNLVRLAF
jgi:hypothetical protein